MAVPFKNGADLYNNEVLRMRLHNLGADPTEVGAGLIYFNTSNGLNTSKKARIYTGDAWKTLAFVEDLDVASNADFIALQEKVALLAGDVDTDAIISNMKEVSAFLEGFEEDASLMDYLNTELGKKLDKTGGTISGNLDINSQTDTAARQFRMWYYASGRRNIGMMAVDENTLRLSYFSPDDGINHQLNIGRTGLTYIANTYEFTLLHSGNYSNYALPLSGGTLTNLLFLEYANPRIAFKSDANTTLGAVGFKDGVLSANITADNKWYTLLHSGNIGEYALKLDGSNIAPITINANNNLDDYRYGYVTYKDANNPTNSYGENAVVMALAGAKDNVTFQLAFDGNGGKLGYRRKTIQNAWSNWRTIAFTDSNVASAQALVHSNGTVGATVVSTGRVDFSTDISMALGKSILDPQGRAVFMIDGNNSPQIGLDTCGSYSTYINGKDVYLRYGASRTTGILLNSSGNVTIGSTDAAGTSAKLFVDGNTRISGSILLNRTSDNADAFRIGNVSNTNNLEISALGGNGAIVFKTNTSGSETEKMRIAGNGNVLIGTNQDNGAKLQVAGVISTNNRIYAPSIFLEKDEDGIYLSQAAISWHGPSNVWSSDLMTFEKYAIKLHQPTEVIGNLHVTGNIIADGEVSAGGAGEEGSGSGSGAGAFHSENIAVGATQTTIAHGLGTDDIVVSIYEKDATSGLWSMILTDIEITDANNIRVTFGSATTVEHKVVIMGAVA